MSQYLFDNATTAHAGQRFASLEALFDPATILHLEATGVGTGWHSLEVGGGGGSIASWLAHRVGPTGHVLVTDINPQFLNEIEGVLALLDDPDLVVSSPCMMSAWGRKLR